MAAIVIFAFNLVYMFRWFSIIFVHFWVASTVVCCLQDIFIFQNLCRNLRFQGGISPENSIKFKMANYRPLLLPL